MKIIKLDTLYVINRWLFLENHHVLTAPLVLMTSLHTKIVFLYSKRFDTEKKIIIVM